MPKLESELECRQSQLEMVGVMEDVQNLKEWAGTTDARFDEIDKRLESLEYLHESIQCLDNKIDNAIDIANKNTDLLQDNLITPISKLKSLYIKWSLIGLCTVAIGFLGVQAGIAKFILDVLKEILK